MLLKILREGLGRIIVLADWATRPRQLVRSVEEQAAVEAKTKNMALYQFYACPFCVKTRRTMHRLNLPIETRNARMGSEWRRELEESGGKLQVPSLKIIDEKGSETWLYESSDIIRFLEHEFAGN